MMAVLRVRYPVSLSALAIPAVLWVLWMVGWAVAPASELVWPPLKWIFLILFAPIGLILLGCLGGYRITLARNTLAFGFFPFTRSLHLGDVAEIHAGGDGMTMWRTTEFLTVVTARGERIAIPCNGAAAIVAEIGRAIGGSA